MLQVEDHVYDRSRDRFGTLERKADTDLWVVVTEGYGGPAYVSMVPDRQLDLVCPFCPNQIVDSDWRACPDCREII